MGINPCLIRWKQMEMNLKVDYFADEVVSKTFTHVNFVLNFLLNFLFTLV